MSEQTSTDNLSQHHSLSSHNNGNNGNNVSSNGKNVTQDDTNINSKTNQYEDEIHQCMSSFVDEIISDDQVAAYLGDKKKKKLIQKVDQLDQVAKNMMKTFVPEYEKQAQGIIHEFDVIVKELIQNRVLNEDISEQNTQITELFSHMSSLASAGDQLDKKEREMEEKESRLESVKGMLCGEEDGNQFYDVLGNQLKNVYEKFKKVTQ